MANLYTIEDLLIGKSIAQKLSADGEIISAEKSPQDPLWYGENTEAYLVEIFSAHTLRNTYRTVAVKVGD
jgi:hypothetical protein